MTISNKNTRVQVTIPKELKNELDVLRKKNNRTLSNLIVYISEKYVEDTHNNYDTDE